MLDVQCNNRKEIDSMNGGRLMGNCKRMLPIYHTPRISHIKSSRLAHCSVACDARVCFSYDFTAVA